MKPHEHQPRAIKASQGLLCYTAYMAAISASKEISKLVPQDTNPFSGGYRQNLPATVETDFDELMEDANKLSVASDIALLRLRNHKLIRMLDPNSLESRFRNLEDARDDMEAARKCGDSKLILEAVDQMLHVMKALPDEGVIYSEIRLNSEQIRKLSETEVKHLHRSMQVLYQEQTNKLKAGIIAAIIKNVPDNNTRQALASDISTIFSA